MKTLWFDCLQFQRAQKPDLADLQSAVPANDSLYWATWANPEVPVKSRADAKSIGARDFDITRHEETFYCDWS